MNSKREPLCNLGPHPLLHPYFPIYLAAFEKTGAQNKNRRAAKQFLRWQMQWIYDRLIERKPTRTFLDNLKEGA